MVNIASIRVVMHGSFANVDWRLTPNWLPSYASVLPNRNRLPGLLDNALGQLCERFVAGGQALRSLMRACCNTRRSWKSSLHWPEIVGGGHSWRNAPPIHTPPLR